jgi:DNA-binding response OmpR family regulator
MTRIAIIEDEPIDSDNMKRLIEESMSAEVRQAFNKADADGLLRNEKFDLVIMDVELGAGSRNRYAGLGLLVDIHATWPTIVVSGMPEQNVLRGMSLTLHAYDFIAKPIDEIDFVNKVERALDWASSDAGRDRIAAQGLPEGLTTDPKRKNEYLWKGRPVQLTITEMRIVECLIEHPGKVVENRKLQNNLKSGSPKAVVTHMSGVRAKFRDVDPAFDRIDNDPGRGYLWKTDS